MTAILLLRLQCGPARFRFASHSLLVRPLVEWFILVAPLVALLVHLRVLAVRRLGVTAAVTTGTVIRNAVWSRILSHALWETGTVCAILRGRRAARGRWLVPDRWQLGVRGWLPGHTNCLSHLSVNGGLGRATAVVLLALLLHVLLHLSAVSLVLGLARSLLLLLLGLPLFTDFLKF
jgi:hypothetical protein